MIDTIPEELERFVSDGVASGKFRSRADVIVEGLRLLREREQKRDALRADLQAGLDELDRGEGILIQNEAEQHAFFEDIRRRGEERLAASQGPT